LGLTINIDQICEKGRGIATEKDKFDLLKAAVNQKYNTIPKRLSSVLKVHLFNDDFKQLFQKVKKDLYQGPNLFFIDQNGVKHTPAELIIELEDFQKTDYLFFISSAFFIRFQFENCFPEFDINKDEIQRSDIHREIVIQYF